jgi:hypothetical protein
LFPFIKLPSIAEPPPGVLFGDLVVDGGEPSSDPHPELFSLVSSSLLSTWFPWLRWHLPNPEFIFLLRSREQRVFDSILCFWPLKTLYTHLLNGLSGDTKSVLLIVMTPAKC